MYVDTCPWASCVDEAEVVAIGEGQGRIQGGASRGPTPPNRSPPS